MRVMPDWPFPVSIPSKRMTHHLSEPVLTSVTVVCRSLPLLAPLTHVAGLIGSFLDTSRSYTLERGSRLGFVHLLDRLKLREFPGVNAEFRAARRSHGVRMAAQAGDLRVLQWWMSRYDDDCSCSDTINYIAFKAAVEAAQQHVAQWLYDDDRVPYEKLETEPAIECYDSLIIYWLVEINYPHKIKVFSDMSARKSNLEALKWAHSHPEKFVFDQSSNGMLIAAELGHLEILQWMYANLPIGRPIKMLRVAATNGHLNVVKWLCRTFPTGYFMLPDSSTISNGHFEVVRWLTWQFKWQSQYARESWIMEGIDAAILSGHIDILRYLYELRPVNRRNHALRWAAYSGNIALVKWLDSLEAENSPWSMNDAAANGHLEIVQWLHSHRREGCTTDAMDRAAGNNHTIIVRWLHTHRTEGCTTGAMDRAAANGHLQMVQWLHENREEGCTKNAIDSAAMNGHFDVVKWLLETRSEGCTVRAMTGAADNGYLEILECLYANQAPMSTSIAIERATINGHLRVVQWLYDHGSEGCSTKALSQAALNGHVDIVQFFAKIYNIRGSFNSMKQMYETGQFALLEWVAEHDRVFFDAVRV